MKNHCAITIMLPSISLFFLACFAGMAMAEEETTIQRPSTFSDDLYHCKDPTDSRNGISCDPITYRWDLGDLNPSKKPDDSLLCQEVVKILVRAREEENLEPGQLQAEQTQSEVQLWETIMESTVVDQLEPCVLWAMSYGSLTPWAWTMGIDDKGLQHQHVEINDNSDPMSSMLETEFDPIVIALAWNVPLPEPLSLDRAELHDLTGRHILDALKAELGSDKVTHLDLIVTAGLPDYQTQILPLTLSGTVVFGDHRQALGPSSLQKLILQTTFLNENARDLYLFRLKISEDLTLQMVSTILAGRESVAGYILQEPSRKKDNSSNGSAQQLIDMSNMDLSEDDEGFVSKLLVAIISAVGAAILAVVCFAYFLICRSRTSGKATKTLEEYSSSQEGHSRSARSSNSFRNTKDPKQAYQDDVPAVKTAPTEEAIEEESQYDIEYFAGSDGVSDYEMDTLPPPSILPDSDDDQSVVMSVMEGFEDETVDEQAATTDTQSVDSDANTSLYEYIPDDTSLTSSLMKEPTALEKVQHKGILWSVTNQQKAPPSDSDVDDYDPDTEQAYSNNKDRRSILGPSSDNDSQSHDSNSLLYGTDDNDIMNGPMTSYKMTEMPLSYDPVESLPAHQHPPVLESSSAEQEPGDKKKKFEDLWKDENETDEVASVLNYLDEVQSARKSAENEIEAEPTASMKIIDVATPVQTPERPSRGDSSSAQESDKQLLESLVDIFPPTNVTETTEDIQMNLPLPATLDTNFQESGSVSSSLSGPSNRNSKQHRVVVGESARTKTSNKWANTSSGSVASSGSSVCSTDSSKLRSLLGQGDMNDAAIVFGKEEMIKDDNSMSSGNSNTTPEAEVSMSSCTSRKLKSLLIKSDSRDAASEDGSEDFLFSNNETYGPKRTSQEEGNDFDYYEDDRKDNYLPASLTPRAQMPSREFDTTPDDSTVYSALSAAPSVDETIASDMGWF